MITPDKSSVRQIWLWPSVFGLLTAAGLIAALLGDGWWDAASTLALGIVTLVCIRIWLIPRPPSGS